VVAGDAQSGTVGAELPDPLVVKVVDEDGKPVRGQVVNFRVVSGGGSVFAGSALTNKDGIAQERWTLGAVARDSQKVEVRAVDSGTGQGVVFAVFHATATPAAAASITALAPAAKAGFAGAAVADSPAVKVTDRFGNPVSGVVVMWTADGGSAVSPSTATGAGGVARAAWLLPTRVDLPFTAIATAGARGSAQFTATAVVPPNALLEKVSGDNQVIQAGGTPQPFVVRVRLVDGRPLQGATVVFSGAPQKTDASGLASFALVGSVYTRPAVHQVEFGISGGPSDDFTFTVAAGPAVDTYVYSMPSFVIPSSYPFVGSRFSVVLGARDAFDNPAVGVPITLRVGAGGGSLSPSSVVTSGAQGLATVEFTLGGTPGNQNFWAILPNKADSVSAGAFAMPGAAPITVVTTPDTMIIPVRGQGGITGTSHDAFGNVT
jgi:hypothetical protein